MFLVRLDKDIRVQKVVKRPIELLSIDEDGRILDVELIEKTEIVCDLCNNKVAVEESELDSLPAGFALTDGEYLYEILCEECRSRYYRDLKIYDSLEGDA